MGAATNQVELSQSLISSETGFEVKIRISWPCCAHNGKTKIREKQKIKSVRPGPRKNKVKSKNKKCGDRKRSCLNHSSARNQFLALVFTPSWARERDWQEKERVKRQEQANIGKKRGSPLPFIVKKVFGSRS